MKNTINIKEVKALRKRMQEINSYDLNDCDFVDGDGNTVEFDKHNIKGFIYTGLNNSDFITREFFLTSCEDYITEKGFDVTKFMVDTLDSELKKLESEPTPKQPVAINTYSKLSDIITDGLGNTSTQTDEVYEMFLKGFLDNDNVKVEVIDDYYFVNFEWDSNYSGQGATIGLAIISLLESMGQSLEDSFPK